MLTDQQYKRLRDINGNTCGKANYTTGIPVPNGDCPDCGGLLHRADTLDGCGFEQVVCDECERFFTLDDEHC